MKSKKKYVLKSKYKKLLKEINNFLLITCFSFILVFINFIFYLFYLDFIFIIEFIVFVLVVLILANNED